MEDVLDIRLVLKTLIRQLEIQGKEIASLKAELSSLKEENHLLREQLSKYQHPRDSHNSSLPSSKNPIGKIVNLRKPTGRKSGGQQGHPGKTLEMQSPEKVDKIEILSPHYCTCCGCDLSAIEGEEIERRQQIDIPPVHPVLTEYRTIRKKCTCSQVNEGVFPTAVTPNVSYGAGVHSLVSYFSVCQHLPYKRLTHLMKDIYGLSLSEGSVDNILHRMEKRSYPAYEVIREKLSRSPVVGVDETGTNIHGKQTWSWVWQNEKLTYVTSARSRKKEVFTGVMPQGMPETVLVSDCYAGYFSERVAHHQLCTSHLLRELIYLSEIYDKHPWSEKMAELIREAIHLRKTISGKIEALFIKQRLQNLLEEVIEKNYEKIITLQKRLVKYRDYLFYFLQDENIPPDNNASERAIRVFKIKLKVSGFFQSPEGAQCFAQLHSIADTAKKNMQSPFFALNAAALNA
jgi:transposase